MKKIITVLLFSLSLILSLCLTACAPTDAGNANGPYTSFTDAETDRFISQFGFQVPFVENYGYTVEEYEGYNADLSAFEDGLIFSVTELTLEACKGYIDSLKDNDTFNYEYREGDYYYFSRDGYFVKVSYYAQSSSYTLEVCVISYTFDENEDKTNQPTDDDDKEDDTTEDNEEKFGLKYEKESDGSYSVVGFYGDEDGIVEIPDYYNELPVRYIRASAFYRQETITEVIIGDNVQIIEANVFMYCTSLKKVTLGKNLQLIDFQVFLGCSSLEEITIPKSVTFIGSSTFQWCDKLKSIVLEDPSGWCTSDDFYNVPFPTDEMSDPKTVLEYFTDKYQSSAWIKS